MKSIQFIISIHLLVLCTLSIPNTQNPTTYEPTLLPTNEPSKRTKTPTKVPTTFEPTQIPTNEPSKQPDSPEEPSPTALIKQLLTHSQAEAYCNQQFNTGLIELESEDTELLNEMKNMCQQTSKSCYIGENEEINESQEGMRPNKQ